MLIKDIKSGILVIITQEMWVYNEKEVVFADISIPNRSISKNIDLIRPVDE
jgi:hypothetical protein